MENSADFLAFFFSFFFFFFWLLENIYLGKCTYLLLL